MTFQVTQIDRLNSQNKSTLVLLVGVYTGYMAYGYYPAGYHLKLEIRLSRFPDMRYPNTASGKHNIL